MLVAKGFTQAGLCHFMDAHLSTVSMFQRSSSHNVFLCTFPIMVAQISLTNHPSSYLPSLVTYNERGCSGDSAAAKSKEEGRVAWGEGLEGGGLSKTLLSISMEALLPREEFFCLYRCSFGKRVEPSVRLEAQKQGMQQGTVNHNTHTPTPRVLRAPPKRQCPSLKF